MVDDHVIDSLRRYFEDSYEELKKEWQSNQFEQLSNCPSFKTAHTYNEALNILIKGPDLMDETALKRMIDEELKVENHWKQRKESN